MLQIFALIGQVLQIFALYQNLHSCGKGTDLHPFALEKVLYAVTTRYRHNIKVEIYNFGTKQYLDKSKI